MLLCHNLKEDEFEIHFSNLVFEYQPRIAGVYLKLRGQEQRIEREPKKHLFKREEQVYLSDVPKKLMKDAMFFINDKTVIQTAISTSFMVGNIIAMAGDKRAVFYPSRTFKVSGSTLNNGVVFYVMSVEFDGASTLVTVWEPVNIELPVMTTFYDVKFHLTVKFWPFNVYHNVTPPQDAIKPYGELQIRSVFNQYKNNCRIFSSSVKGLYSPGLIPFPYPDLIQKFYLLDAHPDTMGKLFLLTGFEQDWKANMWRANSLIEVYDENKPKTYDEPRTFKYLTE